MHYEKYLCENMLKTALGTEDTYGNRQDMESQNISRDLWLGPTQNRKHVFHMPPTPYILKPFEKTTIMDIIKKLKNPSNYSVQSISVWRRANSDP
jgi:hypothetical protein